MLRNAYSFAVKWTLKNAEETPKYSTFCRGARFLKIPAIYLSIYLG